jgi:hypothetical protein
MRLNSKNANIERIVVDSLPHSNKIAIFDRKELLNDPKKIQQFKCRTGFERRSKLGDFSTLYYKDHSQ